MYTCVDKNNYIIDIDEYCTNIKLYNTSSEIFCPNCGKQVIVRAKNSINRTHFSHKPNESCSYKSYDDLFHSKGNPKTSQDILCLKIDIIKYSYTIFSIIQTNFIPTLTVDLFLNTLKSATTTKILKLQKVTCQHIPYIWLNELGKYNNKVYLYTTSDRLNSAKRKLWNLSTKKDILITTELLLNKQICSKVTNINLTSEYISPNLDFINKILNRIFIILDLNDQEQDNVMHSIFNNA